MKASLEKNLNEDRAKWLVATDGSDDVDAGR